MNNNTTILFLDPTSLGICATLDSHNHSVEMKARHANISFAPNIISSSKYLLPFFLCQKQKPTQLNMHKEESQHFHFLLSIYIKPNLTL